MEVLPHHHQAGAERPDEDLEDEVLGGLVGPFCVEGDHDGEVHPVAANSSSFWSRSVRRRVRSPGAPRWRDGGRM